MPFYRLHSTTDYFVNTTTPPGSGFALPIDTKQTYITPTYAARCCEHIMTTAVGFTAGVYCLADTPDANTSFCSLHTS